ncbi:unnamed protein product, partial [Dovyalis caffra]
DARGVTVGPSTTSHPVVQLVSRGNCLHSLAQHYSRYNYYKYTLSMKMKGRMIDEDELGEGETNGQVFCHE